VSETNHPFPNEWSSEGIPIIAAYAGFQDWDAVIMYTFEPKLAADWKPYVGDPFDISLDPVRMTEMATGALMFVRGDVHSALKTVERSYTREEAVNSRRLPPSEQPYFTPGFPLQLPLQHGVRIGSFDGTVTEKIEAPQTNPIVSDTKELSWYTPAANTGLVTVETERTQALIGFVTANGKTLKNLSADLANPFASIVLASMDAKPIATSAKMLLTTGTRVANTGMKWNDAGTRVMDQGGSPTRIDPIAGTILLRNLAGAKGVQAMALDGAGRTFGEPLQGKKTAEGWSIGVGEPPTTWYVVTVKR
jgi:hypothetical protein